MAFKVHFVPVHQYKPGETMTFEQDHQWKLIENGVLEITKPDNTRLLYSPFHWAWIEAGEEPAPTIL
jgi:hypothetical protein